MLSADEQSWDIGLDQIVFEVVVVVVCECDCNDDDYFAYQYFAVNVVVEVEPAEVEIVEVVVLVQAPVVVVKLAEILQIKSSLSKTTPNSCLFPCSGCRGRQREKCLIAETNLELFRNLSKKC